MSLQLRDRREPGFQWQGSPPPHPCPAPDPPLPGASARPPLLAASPAPPLCVISSGGDDGRSQYCVAPFLWEPSRPAPLFAALTTAPQSQTVPVALLGGATAAAWLHLRAGPCHRPLVA